MRQFLNRHLSFKRDWKYNFKNRIKELMLKIRDKGKIKQNNNNKKNNNIISYNKKDKTKGLLRVEGKAKRWIIALLLLIQV